jgi:DNA-binding GntR family transcriptional regulator
MKKQDVYKDIRKRILNHDLEPGQWLVERDLSEEYGISRTPVREILFRLLADGLLHREPSRGFMVRALNVEQVVEVFQAREAVEGMAARLACERMGAREHEKLKDLQNLSRRLTLTTSPSWEFNSDVSFTESSRNRLVTGYSRSLHTS